MSNIMISPGKYVQGAGEPSQPWQLRRKAGNQRAYFDQRFRPEASRGTVGKSCTEAGLSLVFDLFQGECSKTEINRLLKLMEANGCNVVIGIGGGKFLIPPKP